MVPAGPCSQVVLQPVKVRSAVTDQVLYQLWVSPGLMCEDLDNQHCNLLQIA